MQLVGATKSFIRRPFIWHHLRLGLLGAIIASGGLGYLLYEVNLRFPELALLNNPNEACFDFYRCNWHEYFNYRGEYLFLPPSVFLI